MALETSRLNFQLQNFSRVLTQNAVSLEQYTKNSGSMLSLASQIKSLHTFEKKHETQMDAPTSGESSPCMSDSEKDTRPSMPTLQEISELLTDELALEVEAPAERFKGFYGKDLTLIFEDFDTGFPKNKFYRHLKETKYSSYISDRIVHAREMKFVCFRGNNSLLVDFHVKKSDLLGGFMETFHAFLKKETRRPIKMHKVVDDRRNKDLFFGVIIRNLPPKVTQKEIINQCQKEVTGQIIVGTLIKVKERHCCIIRCDYLEDVEIICKKLNNFSLKDPTTNMKYVIKAHLHPQSALRHLIKDKSLFAEFVESRDKNVSDKASGKAGKTGVHELLEIFNKSKKTSDKQHEKQQQQQHKPPPPPPIIAKRNESMDEEKAPPPPVNGMDILKKFYSAPGESQTKIETTSTNITMETQEGSIFTKMIKTTTESTTQEAEPKGSQEGSLNEKENLKEEKENQMKTEEEAKNPEINTKIENNERKNFEGNGTKLYIKKDYEGKRHDSRRNERSSSRHDKRSSSRTRRRQNYDKNDYSSRRESKYDSRDYDRQKKNRSHKESRERKRNHSRSKVSKSKSKSRSRSRSKNRVKSRKSDYESKRSRNKPDYEKSPKRSGSPNKKKYSTKNRSRSGSKTRSRSGHRDKYKEDKGKNKTAVTLYEYEHKDNRSGTRSPSASKKNKKRRDSHSRSVERSKRRHDNKSPHKSSYYNHSRDKYHDYQKDSSYNRNKDNRDTKNYNDYKSSNRKGSYYSRNDYRDQDDKQRRRNRDNDKQQRDKEKSRSRNSKSPNRRSPSRSKSSKGSRERRIGDSIERKPHIATRDFDVGSKAITAGADKEGPQEKN